MVQSYTTIQRPQMDVRICIHIIGPWTSMVWWSTHGKKKGTKPPLPLMTTRTQTIIIIINVCYTVNWHRMSVKNKQWRSFFFLFSFPSWFGCSKKTWHKMLVTMVVRSLRDTLLVKKHENPTKSKCLCINCCTQMEILMWLCMPRPKYHGQYAPEVGTF